MKLNKNKIKYIVGEMKKGTTTYQISRNIKVSISRVYQIWKEYNKTGVLPVLSFQTGRPKKYLTEEQINLILKEFNETRFSASILEKIIKQRYSILINHNKIHELLLQKGFAKTIGMKIRKRKWVRYERKHSLTAVHMDWHYDPTTGKWIIAVLDDSSRMILAYGEFEHATSENTIYALKQALEYGKIKQVITDHGSQFTANKFDSKGNAYSQFEEFCRQNKIKHILCRIKHPQSNGKIERWFGLYKQKGKFFLTLKEFVYWYNHVKPHLSLNFEELETPVQAFERKFKR